MENGCTTLGRYNGREDGASTGEFEALESAGTEPDDETVEKCKRTGKSSLA